MTTLSSDYDLARSEKSTPEINLVATVKFPPEYFTHSHQLEFIDDSDDLDFLVYAFLDLPSGNSISLVRHQNAPYPGTEIYLSPNLSNPSQILSEAISFLRISPDDLDWIHPQISLRASI